MSYLNRSVSTFVLALLTVATVGVATASQVSAVKDGWLVMKVHSEMIDEDVLSGSNIDVDVKNGVVTLQGTVPSEAARARAIAVAKANDGVKGVTDQLRVVPGARAGTMERAADKTARAADKAEDKAQRAGDKTANAAEKAVDKTAAAGRKTRPGDRRWLDQVEDLRAVHGRLEHRAQRQRYRRRCREQHGDVERHREVRRGQGQGRLDREGDRRREGCERQPQGRRRHPLSATRSFPVGAQSADRE